MHTCNDIICTVHIWLWLALQHKRQWQKIPRRQYWIHSSLIENSLSAENIIDNINKELDRLSRSFVTGCLHNVQFCFSCNFLDVTQKPEIGMQRSASRHTDTNTHTCAAQHRTGHAWVCTNRGCLSLSGTSVRRGRCSGLGNRRETWDKTQRQHWYPMISVLTTFASSHHPYVALKRSCCSFSELDLIQF